MKNEEIYNSCQTEKFLKRTVLVAVSKKSGLAGIANGINNYYNLKDEKQVDKSSELVTMVKAWVDKEYEAGRVTVLTDDELTGVINETCDRLKLARF